MEKRIMLKKVIIVIVGILIWCGLAPFSDKSYAQERRVWIPTETRDIVYLYKEYQAIIIAAGKYERVPRLVNPPSDAKEISRTLQSLGFQTQIVLDPAAEQLRMLFRNLPDDNRISVEDKALLIYFSGHGATRDKIPSGQVGYILPVDVNPDRLPASAISMEEVVLLAHTLKNWHVFMVFDSCFSGTIFEVLRPVPTTTMTQKLARPARQFLTAGTATDAVPDNSTFKGFFIKGLKGAADINRDGYITGTELATYIQNETARGNISQHPQFGTLSDKDERGALKYQGDFVLTQRRMEGPVLQTGDVRNFPDPTQSRWYVYNDADYEGNHGYWTNYMPDNAGRMIDLSLVERNNVHSASASAVRVKINLQDPGWCGLAVTVEPDYWGKSPSELAYNLSRAKKLVFHAKGEAGNETIQVKVAIASKESYGDSSKSPAATKWISLTQNWEKYELSLEGYDLSRVITPFCFLTDRSHNDSNAFTFYLDEIYFEMR